MRNPHIFYDGNTIKCSVCSTEDFQPEQGQPKKFRIWGARPIGEPTNDTYYWIVECYTCNKTTAKPKQQPYLEY